MTLEDLFTLTEMKNGLATLARVEELISRMKQQKDCAMTNVGDAIRQWSTVASTLAATESKDCLHHFVKLDGLSFLNQWLQEALKHSNGIGDTTTEEFIHAFLGSLEKLPIDREHSTASGIHMTIEKLLPFKGVNKERLRDLSERWKCAGDNVDCEDKVKSGALTDDKPKCSSDVDAVDSANSTSLDVDNTSRGRNNEGGCRMESVVTETRPDASQQDSTKDVHPTVDQTMPSVSSVTADANILSSSLPSNSYQENNSRTDESSVCRAAETTSRGTWQSSDAVGSGDDQKTCHASMLKVDDDDAKAMNMEIDKKEGTPLKSCQQDKSKTLASSSYLALSPAQKPERSVSCNFDIKEEKYHMSEKKLTLPRSISVDCVPPNLMRSKELKPVVPEFHGIGLKLTKREDTESSSQKKEDVESDSEDEETDYATDLIIKRDIMNHQNSSGKGKMNHANDSGSEDGELDALELARQVAIEVEREVVDYREPFCSSSPEDSSGEVVHAQNSLVDEKRELDQPAKEEINGNEASPGKSLSGDTSSQDVDNKKTPEIEVGSHSCQNEAPEQKPEADKSSGKSDREMFDFDLNEDLGNNENDSSVNQINSHSVTVSTPIAVSASKRALLLPVAPISFEGENGWKGSAATSAFRPASPRKTDSEKTYAGKKRKSELIEIDLNVAESADDEVTPVQYPFRSHDDFMETSSRKTDRLKLDLNRLSDDGVSPDPFSHWRLPHLNSEQTLSPASSSSSRQPSMRDFDLNDNPNFFDFIGSHNHKTPSTKAATGMYQSSTMNGSRMAAERKDFLNDTRQSFEPAGMLSSRPMMPYGQVPLSTYGYNPQMMGPPVSFANSVYAPAGFPYIVDSRGASTVPHIMGGSHSGGLQGASSATPSFFMNVPTAQSSATRNFLDLSPGLSTVDAGNRDVGSFKHVFMQQGHNGLMEKR